MAEKKTTAKKVAKKAPVKKAVAKKAVAKKTPAKKEVAKKALVKKAVAKKAVAKKTPAKKEVAKKAVTKKAVAKKSVAKKATATKPAVKKAATTKTSAKKATVKKTAAPKPAVRRTTSKKSSAIESAVLTAPDRLKFDTNVPSRAIPNPTKSSGISTTQFTAQQKTGPAKSITPKEKKEKSNSKGLIVLVGLVVLGTIGYVGINSDSSKKSSVPTQKPTPVESAVAESKESPSALATTEAAKPTAVAESVGSVTASYAFTSTGIRLSWAASGGEIAGIQVSSAEDQNDFTELTSVSGEVRSLRITKIDTKGWTKFKVTIQPVSGDPYSTTIGLRGRFTL